MVAPTTTDAPTTTPTTTAAPTTVPTTTAAPTANTCPDFGAVATTGGAICCPASCGSCGGSGCGSRPGGAAKCCTGDIPKDKICDGTNAPCYLDNGKIIQPNAILSL